MPAVNAPRETVDRNKHPCSASCSLLSICQSGICLSGVTKLFRRCVRATITSLRFLTEQGVFLKYFKAFFFCLGGCDSHASAAAGFFKQHRVPLHWHLLSGPFHQQYLPLHAGVHRRRPGIQRYRVRRRQLLFCLWMILSIYSRFTAEWKATRPTYVSFTPLILSIDVTRRLGLTGVTSYRRDIPFVLSRRSHGGMKYWEING